MCQYITWEDFPNCIYAFVHWGMTDLGLRTAAADSDQVRQ